MSTYPEPLAFDMPAVLHIERPSTWEFDHMKQEQRPFLMKGCLDEWPLYQELHALSSVGEKTAYLRRHDANKRISFVALRLGDDMPGQRPELVCNLESLKDPPVANASSSESYLRLVIFICGNKLTVAPYRRRKRSTTGR
jgi:hypothetical protein